LPSRHLITPPPRHRHLKEPNVPIVVTGATGQLGRLVVQNLLDRGTPAAQIVAAGRDVTKIADLAGRGVDVRAIDFGQPQTLKAAFDGADRVLLVSGSEPGGRIGQHRNAIEAAKAAGVGLLAYTSVLHAGATRNPLAVEHEATEQLVAESGLPYAFLRNGWYTENYTAQLPMYLQQGGVIGSAGQGRISAATRADFAAAAATVLAGDVPAGDVPPRAVPQAQAYELAGDHSFTLAELAAEISRQTGTQLGYTDLAEADHAAALLAAGLPEPVAGLLAAVDGSIAGGDLFDDSRTLSRLIGRPTTPLSDAVAAALATR
jgi:NAD(P)H dehydrogenase (quinone)